MSRTIDSVTPPKRYAAAVRVQQRAKRSEDQDGGSEEKHVWREMARTRPPTEAPSAVPTNRFQETENAAPSEDCEVVIGAQLAS